MKIVSLVILLMFVCAFQAKAQAERVHLSRAARQQLEALATLNNLALHLMEFASLEKMIEEAIKKGKGKEKN